MDKFRGEHTTNACQVHYQVFNTFWFKFIINTTTEVTYFKQLQLQLKNLFKHFKQHNLKRQDERDQLRDIFGTALASEYDLEAQRIKS